MTGLLVPGPAPAVKGFVMTMPTETCTDGTALDERIVSALLALRRARAVCLRRSAPENLEVERRAEESLNQFLEYRHAAERRRALAHETM
jgi:hypothetical protein